MNHAFYHHLDATLTQICDDGFFKRERLIASPQRSTLRLASGLVSLGFGLYLVYVIGFVHGLFTGSPNWNPH